MRRRYSVEVRGDAHEWAFEIDADPEDVADWRADGLEVYEIMNTVPLWVARYNLTTPWCFLQDLFYFRNPFK